MEGTFGPSDESNLTYPELSPDGTRAAVVRLPVGSGDIWIQESARRSRFTFDPADDRWAIWSPDGARVVFGSNRKGTYDLYQKAANGDGQEEILLASRDIKRPNSWSPDGRYILYENQENNGDLMVMPLTGDGKPFAFLSTPFGEHEGVFSPDGKWIAYQSNESGRWEIYVRPFPSPGGQWQVSSSGGTSPRWRADGKELYYVALDNKLMAASISAHGLTLVSGSPEALFQTRIAAGINRPQYDVARNGWFLINTELDDTSIEPIHLLLNWKSPPK